MAGLLSNFDFAVGLVFLVSTVPLTIFESKLPILSTNSFSIFDMLSEPQYYANSKEFSKRVSHIKIGFASPKVKLLPMPSSAHLNH